MTIPAGEFTMGSDKSKDSMACDDETPQHKLTLPEYRIARIPVTVAQFARFVEATQLQDNRRDEWRRLGLVRFKIRADRKR